MVFIEIAVVTLFLSVLFQKIFANAGLKKSNYRGKIIPFSGGITILAGITAGLMIFYSLKLISAFKMSFFLISLSIVYLIGLIDDLLGDKNIKGIKNNLNLVFKKKLSTSSIKAIAILIASCYIYYFFNEEMWLMKGILTSLVTNTFNEFDLRPGRCIKLYYFIFILLSFALIRWTRDAYLITFIVLAAYYYFDAYEYSMLGDGGSNLIGFVSGLMITEASGRLWITLTLVAGLSLLQLLLDRYSLTSGISSIPLIDNIDKFLTVREDDKFAKP